MKSYSDSALKDVAAGSMGFRRTAALNLLTDRGNLKPEGKFNTQTIEAGMKTAERYGASVTKTKELGYQWAQTDDSRKVWIKDHLKKADKAVINKLDAEFFKMPEMHEYMNAEKMKTIFERGGTAAENYFNSLKTLGDSIDAIANNFAGKGNVAMSDWLKSTKATPIIKAYGISAPTTPFSTA